jgi:hypothetical protein
MEMMVHTTVGHGASLPYADLSSSRVGMTGTPHRQAHGRRAQLATPKRVGTHPRTLVPRRSLGTGTSRQHGFCGRPLCRSSNGRRIARNPRGASWPAPAHLPPRRLRRRHARCHLGRLHPGRPHRRRSDRPSVLQHGQTPSGVTFPASPRAVAHDRSRVAAF